MESRRKDRLLVRLFEELQEADLSMVTFGEPVSKENSPDTIVDKQPELDKESEKLQKEQEKKAEPPKEEKAPKNQCLACREGEVIDGKCNKCGSTTPPAGGKPKAAKESVSEAVPEPMYKVIATVSNADVAKKVAADNKGEVKQTKDGRWEVLVKVSEAEEEEFKVGDRVVSLGNFNNVGVKEGDRGYVIKIERDLKWGTTLTIRWDNGKETQMDYDTVEIIDSKVNEDDPNTKAEPKEEKPKGERFEVTDVLVDELGKKLGVDFEKIDRAEFKKGLEIEQEHADVTKGDPEITAKIALAHISEIPDYYKRLVKMETDAKAGEAHAIEDDKQEDLIIAFDEDSLSKEVENFIVKKLGFAVTGVGDGVVEFEGKGDAKKIERAIRDNFGWMLKFDVIRMADFLEENAVMLKDEEFMKQHVNEVSPPGWEPTVKAMKKHKEITNPWALAWWMKKKGYKSHVKESAVSEQKINEEDSWDRMKFALDKFIAAGWELFSNWNRKAARNYPSYLPSFKEFLNDFSALMYKMEEGNASEEEMKFALDKFIAAGWELFDNWNHGEAHNYPSYLPPFDEFLTDFNALMDKPEEAVSEKKWMQKAFSKHKGALHRALGVPEDEDIPVEKMRRAYHSDDINIKRMAIAAVNANPDKYGSIKGEK